MADLKISALNSLAGADLVAADVVAVVDDSASETKKLTVSDLIANGTTLISDATIPSAKILFSAGAIDTAQLAASAVETAKINDSAVTAAKLADNSSVTLVSTLPGSGDFIGQIALDTDDNSIVVWNGSAWLSPVASGSINVVNGSTTGEVNIVATKSGSTVTISATLDDTSAAAQFLAGPTGAGGTVGYRAIIGTDLPTASSSAKGGVIVNGNGLAMSGDTITVNNSVTAETSENHLVKYDANGLITSGRAIAAGDIPLATSSVTGAVKPGSGLEVTGAGAINHSNSVTGATAAKVTFDAQGHITASEALAATDIPDLDAAKITTGTLPTARLANDAVTADKLGDKSTTTIAEATPAGGDFIGQGHLNSISGDFLIWDGNVWQPIGISVGEIVLAGTYNASTNKMATVTSEGTALSFVVGSALPAASASNKGYYVVVSTAGTGTSPAPTVALNPPDFLLSTGTAYTEIDVSSTVIAQQASNVAFTAAGNISATNVQSAIEELDSEKVAAASPTFTGTVALGEDAVITFEGATDNAFETTLTVVDPTADRTVSLPNVTGTLISSGDTGSVTSAMIADGAIVNADINAGAEIAVSKLANGTARQLLQTDAAGSGVEFTSNVDVPGTLDVTGAATLDSTLTVTGLISADGKVKFPAGSASAPSFYSGTDTNTGLYFSAADEVSITTGGTQRIAVDSSGRVLIGTSTNSAPGGYNAKLQLADTSFTGSISMRRDSDNIQSQALIFGKSRGALNGSTIVQNNDNVGSIIWYAADGIDLNTAAAQIDVQIDGTPGANDMPGRLVFSTTADGASSPSERLRIDSSGNVGIGTTAPSEKLGVAGNLQFEVDDGVTIGARESLSINLNSSGGQTNRVFHVKDNGTSRFTVEQAGNVGIGTTSPGTRLHVNGTTPIMRVSNGTTQIVELKADSSASILRTTTNHPLLFGTNDTERLRIDSSGRLLVGTTSQSGTANQASIHSAGKNTLSIIDTTSYASGVGGAINLGGNYRSTGDAQAFVRISAVKENGTDNNYSYGMQFDTTANGGSNFGTSAMRIDSSGRLGIGTTAPTETLTLNTASGASIGFEYGGTEIATINNNNAALYVHAGSGKLLSLGAGGSERMRIDSSGRLLIGTTTAFDSGSDTLLQVSSTGGARFALARNDTTTAANDSIGRIRWYGNDSDGNYDECARIEVIADADHASDSKPSALTFHTTAASSESSSERVRIDSSGRVLISSSTSQAHANMDDLQVGNGSGNRGITISSGTSNYGTVAFGDSADGSGTDRYEGFIEYYHDNNSLRLGTAAQERFRVDSSGNVGIGVTSLSSSSRLTLLESAGNAQTLEIKGANSSGVGSQPGIKLTASSGDNIGGVYGDTSADAVILQTGGTERMRIGSAGQIGLGGANYGTSGQVLTSNGSSSAPTWQDGGGGGSTDLAAVGTYAFCANFTNEGSPGGTRSGSELKYTNAGVFSAYVSPSTGTWRQMGDADSTSSSSDRSNTLWVRVS